MNGKTVRRSGMALLALLACVGLTGCNNSSMSATESVPQTGIALLRYTSAGAPDTSFGGGDGIVVTDIDLLQFDFAIAAALQPADGKIIVAGRSVLGTQGVIALLRYNADGTLDTNFGNGGIVRTAVGSVDAIGSAVAVQSTDGKILVAGITFTASTGTTGIAVVRYSNTDGALDKTFAGGIVTAAIGSGSDADTASLALQSDGKIVVAGATSTGDIVLFRYNTDGLLDSTFGITGKVTTTVGSGAMSPAIVLQTDGKIVAAGSVGNFTTPTVDAVLLRYNADGTLDLSFGGGDGIVVTDIGSSVNFANAVALQPDGKIIVAGHAFVDFRADTSDIALLRYNANGTLDSTFGGGTGVVVTDLGAFDNALSVALQPTGEILVSGNTGSGGIPRAAVLRYTAGGVLDLSFGTGGVVTAFATGPSTITSANAVVLQTDGKIVVAGYD